MNWLSNAFRSVGRILGIGRRDVGRAVVSGVGNALTRRGERRAAREASEREFEDQRRLDNNQANQDRESMLYEMQLAEWQRQRRRREIARGGANFAQFSGPIPGYTNRAPMDTTPVAPPVAPRINL